MAIGNVQILICHQFWQEVWIFMKILNFHYVHSHQTCFCYCNVTFVFVLGNQFLHIYVEPVIYKYCQELIMTVAIATRSSQTDAQDDPCANWSQLTHFPTFVPDEQNPKFPMSGGKGGFMSQFCGDGGYGAY